MSPRLPSGRRSGVAMVVVLLTLVALLVLCTPFLLTVRNADLASVQTADRASARLALDDASRLARGRLGFSHPGLDSTPYHDSLDELSVSNRFDEAFLDANDASGPMFDLEHYDVSGRVDLNSAPPQMLGNLMDATGLTVGTVELQDVEVSASSVEGFLPEGFFWIDGELIGYTGLEGSTFQGCIRGLGVETDAEGDPLPCGPRPPQTRPRNRPIVDQRAYALAQWRIWTPDGTLRTYDSFEHIREAQGLVMAGELGPDAMEQLRRTTTVHAGIQSGPEWQRATRVENAIQGGIDCTLRLRDARWFSEGTTVMITDGITTELGIVRTAGRANAITLMDPPANDYNAFTALAVPLARRPVNINTASLDVLRALVLHLQLRNRQGRISPAEARVLTQVIAESRPFTSFQDFVERLVLPAGGFEPWPDPVPETLREMVGGQTELASRGAEEGEEVEVFVPIIDEDDARALYKNAVNANDAELGFSTMPFSFVSNDVHAMELRAAINAPSGVQRARGSREQIELIVPQRDLLFLATRQEDFERSLRLTREAPGWATGPRSTSRWDTIYNTTPPTRSRAHLGPRDTMPAFDPLAQDAVYTFASRDEEEDGYALPWAYRTAESGFYAGRVEHFDHEARDAEGRYLPDGTVVRGTDDGMVGWNGPFELQQPLAFSMWLQPRALESGARYFDVGGPYIDTDRISLELEDNDLVLRVIDGTGDHPFTAFEERGELRYDLSGNGPGLPLDTWIHLQVDIRGNRPDQMTMLVDGRYWARTPGLTRLSGPLSGDSTVIPVESTEGFPARCILVIGTELIEATVAGPTSFSAVYGTQGENAGFGGRLARQRFGGVELTGDDTPLNISGLGVGSFPAGTTVQLYGGAPLLASNVPAVQGELASDLGTFAVGRVVGMAENEMEAVVVLGASGNAFNLGLGLDTQASGSLEIQPADPNMTPEQVMAAFSPSGGYAALLWADFAPRIQDDAGTVSPVTTVNGTRFGEIEVIHYTGFEGNLLQFDRRGDNLPELENLANAGPDIAGRGAFIFDFQQSGVSWNLNPPPWEQYNFQTKIIPISLPVSGAEQFEPAQAENSKFVQITYQGSQAPSTEWVRYDELEAGQFVRNAPSALRAAQFAVQGGVTQIDADGTGNPPPTGPTPPGPPAPPAPSGSPAVPAPEPPAPPSAPASAAAAAPVDGAYWHWRMGEAEDADFPVTRSVRSYFQFRGVLGTYPHVHSQGAVVLPVWSIADRGVFGGLLGRFDPIFLMEFTPTNPGWPGIVHRAHLPNEYTVYHVQQDEQTPLGVSAGAAPESVGQTGFQLGVQYVALQDAAQVPMTPGSISSDPTNFESRIFARASMFPSGELPRTTTTVAVGGSFRGGGNIPSALVDEIFYGNVDFASAGTGTPGSQLILALDLGELDNTLSVRPNSIRNALGELGFANGRFLDQLPQDAGLLRIGDEILCYDSLDAGSGLVTIASGGRGLLGTDPQPHATGETVTFLQHVNVSVLAAGLDAEDGLIVLAALDGFAREGTVRIDDELIHYDWLESGGLAMPRSSREPGAQDREGPGIFRGRYGTSPAGHVAGTPVIEVPIRYWDRWAEGADAPEMNYFTLSVSQPNAFWGSAFWDVREPAGAGPRLGVLQRTDPEVPWDAPPQGTPGLDLIWDGLQGGEGNPIGRQSDRVEWRVFLRHEPGSFDPVGGMSHAWKRVPRLSYFGAEYMGPGMVLKRVER